MSTLLRRASFPLINRSSISTLLKRLRPPPTAGTATEASKAAAADARTILVRISKICPLMYKSHTAELGKAILDESLADGEGVREAWGAGMGAVPLQAFAHVQKADQSVQTSDKYVDVSSPSSKGKGRKADAPARSLWFRSAGKSWTEPFISPCTARQRKPSTPSD
jgi:hypothetical protein